jgi:[calcium/calmodulin-dependent protein kinase] kinase
MAGAVAEDAPPTVPPSPARSTPVPPLQLDFHRLSGLLAKPGDDTTACSTAAGAAAAALSAIPEAPTTGRGEPESALPSTDRDATTATLVGALSALASTATAAASAAAAAAASAVVTAHTDGRLHSEASSSQLRASLRLQVSDTEASVGPAAAPAADSGVNTATGAVTPSVEPASASEEASTGRLLSVNSQLSMVSQNGVGGSLTPRVFSEVRKMTDSVDENGQRRVNQYIFKEEIGRGASGRVFLCFDAAVLEDCAIKVLEKASLKKRKRMVMRRPLLGPPRPLADAGSPNAPPANADMNDPLVRVQREIAIWKKLTHPNVVRLFEVIDDDSIDELFLVSELVSGGCVMKDELVCETPPLPLAQSYFAQLLEALAYLHFQGIVHRDIKPGNMLISNKPREGAPPPVMKICDFGVSHIVDNDSEEGDAIRNTAGTASFMAPEMLSGEPFSATRADLWAAGMTLYVMVFGQPAFRAKSLPALYTAIRTEEFTWPGETASGLPLDMDELEPVKDIVTRLLTKDPMQRASLAEIRMHPWIRNATLPLGGATQSMTDAQPKIEVTQSEVEKAISSIRTWRAIVSSSSAIKRAVRRARENIRARNLQAEAVAASSQTQTDAGNTHSQRSSIIGMKPFNEALAESDSPMDGSVCSPASPYVSPYATATTTAQHSVSAELIGIADGEPVSARDEENRSRYSSRRGSTLRMDVLAPIAEQMESLAPTPVAGRSSSTSVDSGLSEELRSIPLALIDHIEFANVVVVPSTEQEDIDFLLFGSKGAVAAAPNPSDIESEIDALLFGNIAEHSSPSKAGRSSVPVGDIGMNMSPSLPGTVEDEIDAALFGASMSI